jgi:hypothetical protein
VVLLILLGTALEARRGQLSALGPSLKMLGIRDREMKGIRHTVERAVQAPRRGERRVSVQTHAGDIQRERQYVRALLAAVA